MSYEDCSDKRGKWKVSGWLIGRSDYQAGNQCFTEALLQSYGATNPLLRKVLCTDTSWNTRTYYREKPLSSYGMINFISIPLAPRLILQANKTSKDFLSLPSTSQRPLQVLSLG